MSKTALSTTQQSVLSHLRSHPGSTLYRIPGGFWTYTGCPVRDDSFNGQPSRVPEWSVDIRTIRALERLGYLVRTNKLPEEWRDERRLKED